MITAGEFFVLFVCLFVSSVAKTFKPSWSYEEIRNDRRSVSNCPYNLLIIFESCSKAKCVLGIMRGSLLSKDMWVVETFSSPSLSRNYVNIRCGIFWDLVFLGMTLKFSLIIEFLHGELMLKHINLSNVPLLKFWWKLFSSKSFGAFESCRSCWSGSAEFSSVLMWCHWSGREGFSSFETH